MQTPSCNYCNTNSAGFGRSCCCKFRRRRDEWIKSSWNCKRELLQRQVLELPRRAVSWERWEEVRRCREGEMG
ncbi:unnamed protein product [Amoebophrya sp. A120]|nr:unnamed protein product [Amoebophrya sp. A120]|eukprot:GSA120T00021151001.1